MFNMLIKGGKIVDGSGQPEYIGDIGIKNGQITSMDNLEGADA
jgi:N-acyl-D-amino-acid deacylase